MTSIKLLHVLAPEYTHLRTFSRTR